MVTFDGIKKALAGRKMVVGAAILGFVVTLPALFRGWKIDDFLHRSLVTGNGERLGLLATMRDYFAFIVPETLQQWTDVGVTPWWTDPGLRISFFRPVAALTHWIDYRVWPDSSAAMHLHSLVWYAAACAVAALLYRRFLGATWAAGLAALLFAIDVGHRVPVEWIANRNALLALVAGGLAIAAHDRWRREGWRYGAAAASGCFAISLLSAEAGVATGAYLAAHALWLENGPVLRRVVALAPYVTILVGWRVLYHLMGFGAFGSDLYVDPGREPLRYLGELVERGPVLLFGQLGSWEPFSYNLLSSTAARGILVLAWGVVLLAVVLVFPLFRNDRVTRFWATGLVLAVVPFCSTNIASSRLLLFCSVGWAALLARFLQTLVESSAWRPRALAWRAPAWVAGVLLLAIHGLYSPYRLTSTLAAPDLFQLAVEQATDFAPDEEIDGRTVVVVNAPCTFFFGYHRSMRTHHGRELPSRLRVLSPGQRAVELTRLDERTISVRPENGYSVHPHDPPEGRGPVPNVHPAHLYALFDRTYRGSASPARPGDLYATRGMSVEIVSVTDDGRPGEVEVRFDVPLESPDLYWVAWDWSIGSYSTFEPPVVGQSARVRGPF